MTAIALQQHPIWKMQDLHCADKCPDHSDISNFENMFLHKMLCNTFPPLDGASGAFRFPGESGDLEDAPNQWVRSFEQQGAVT